MTQSADTGELPALRTARRAGLIEQVIDQLREQIVAGTWAIGTRIPTEAELAQLTGRAGTPCARPSSRSCTPGCWSGGRVGHVRAGGLRARRSSEPAGGDRPPPGHPGGAADPRGRGGPARRPAPHPADVALLRGLIDDRNSARAAGTSRPGSRGRRPAPHHRPGHPQPRADRPLREPARRAERERAQQRRHHCGVDENEHVALVDAIESQDPARAETEAASFLDVLLADEGGQRPTSD